MMDIPTKTLLLIGASRGLGYAMAEEYLKRGWQVVATERAGARSRLHDLVPRSGERLEIETVDITDPDQVLALRARLAKRMFDLLFVNAGVKNDDRGDDRRRVDRRVRPRPCHQRLEPDAGRRNPA